MNSLSEYIRKPDFYGYVYFSNEDKKALEPIYEKAKTMYLYGADLTKWLDTNIQLVDRIQYYLKDGLCFECTALSMLLLKDYPTAKIIQGASKVDGKYLRHAWVEFVAGNQKYVSDLSWTIPGISPFRTYAIEYYDRDPRWICDYDMFWSLKRSNELYKWMQDPKTSYVFDDLSSYGRYSEKDIDNFGFNAGVQAEIACPYWDAPFVRNGHVMAKEIVEEFLSDSRIRIPRDEIVESLWARLKK